MNLSILAGMMIAVGAVVYLKIGGLAGALMFAIGLMTILWLKFETVYAIENKTRCGKKGKPVLFIFILKSEGFLALRLDFLSYNNYNVSVWRW